MLKHQGFTIIELILVIAIISVLAVVVLTNVTNIRSKTKDAVIKENISLLKTVAIEYYIEHKNYGGFCNFPETEKIFDAIPSSKKYKYCHADSDQWAVCAQLNLPVDRSKAWCIDNTANVKQIDQTNCVSNITLCQ
jgi:prepilin-type N-terminal cleavage/methylation domain-containing protein